MLYLARVEYTGRNPENLTLIGNKSATEKHLLREFVPAVYPDDPRKADNRRFRCSAQQAKRWLGHLAWPAFRAQTQHEPQTDDPSADGAAADSALLRLTAAADLLAGRQPGPAQEPTSSPAPSG